MWAWYRKQAYMDLDAEMLLEYSVVIWIGPQQVSRSLNAIETRL